MRRDATQMRRDHEHAQPSQNGKEAPARSALDLFPLRSRLARCTATAIAAKRAEVLIFAGEKSVLITCAAAPVQN